MELFETRRVLDFRASEQQALALDMRAAGDQRDISFQRLAEKLEQFGQVRLRDRPASPAS